MKKLLSFLSALILCLVLSLSAQAAENTTIATGYTSDNIYYTVYDIETTEIIHRAVGDTIDVVREFHYSGIITPPSQKIWSEVHNSITYTGTLKLYNFTYKNGNTIAYYKGTLTAIE